MYNEAILAGIIISMVYTELTGLSAGLIIPGYLALSLHSPVRLLVTWGSPPPRRWSAGSCPGS